MRANLEVRTYVNGEVSEFRNAKSEINFNEKIDRVSDVSGFIRWRLIFCEVRKFEHEL